jgi:hypothetical protein
MINRKTVRQILEVLTLFKVKHANGDPLSVARQEAVREVAHRYSVAYQTIEDACRRRLKLNDISEFDTLLQDWIGGEYLRLINQLTSRASSTTHDDIATFFREHTASPERPQENTAADADTSQHEDFTISVSLNDARKLRAIAEIRGIDRTTLFNQIMSRAIRDEMKAFAQAILKDSEQHTRQ